MLTPECRKLFSFKSETTYLDHGGFGVTPKEVTQKRFQISRRIEQNPDLFFDREHPKRWHKASALVAERFSARAGDLALVNNVTTGINAVLRSFPLCQGDEILITSHSHGGVANAVNYIAKQHAANVVEAHIQFPAPSPLQCIEAIKAAITPRTKLAVLDHVTKSSLVFPLQEMIRACHDRGVAVVVDGAHAPGNVPLDIPSLNADWYVGNLHK